MATSIFNTASQNLSPVSAPQSFNQLLSQTNPNGVGFGGSGDGLSLQSTPTGIDGLTYQAGAPLPGTPQFGDASGAYSNTGTGTGTGNVSDIGAYTDQINGLNQLLSQQDGVQQRGEQGINRAFDRSGAQLQDNFNGQNQAYDRQQNDTTRDYGRNLNTIQGQARTGYQGLQALLGGSGSAGEVLAPLAVSNVAGSQTNNAAQGYGKNLESLATARTDAGKQFKSAQDDLLNQKNDKLSNLINSIDQQKIAYNQQLGQAQNQLSIAQGGNYQTPTATNNNIAALQADQNSLGDRYAQSAYTPQNQNYQAPNLQGYTAQAAQIGGLSNQPVNSGDPAAAMQAILASQAKKTNQFAF